MACYLRFCDIDNFSSTWCLKSSMLHLFLCFPFVIVRIFTVWLSGRTSSFASRGLRFEAGAFLFSTLSKKVPALRQDFPFKVCDPKSRTTQLSHRRLPECRREPLLLATQSRIACALARSTSMALRSAAKGDVHATDDKSGSKIIAPALFKLWTMQFRFHRHFEKRRTQTVERGEWSHVDNVSNVLGSVLTSSSRRSHKLGPIDLKKWVSRETTKGPKVRRKMKKIRGERLVLIVDLPESSAVATGDKSLGKVKAASLEDFSQRKVASWILRGEKAR